MERGRGLGGWALPIAPPHPVRLSMGGNVDPYDRRLTDDELRRRVYAIEVGAASDSATTSRDELLALMQEILDLRSSRVAGESPRGQRGWAPSLEAAQHADTVFVDDLPVLALKDLSNWLVVTPESSPTVEHREIFADAIVDLRMLLDEVRFETGLAVAYMAGLGRELARAVRAICHGRSGSLPKHSRSWSRFTPRGGHRARSSPFPGKAIPGNRILGPCWFAGQLLDSALVPVPWSPSIAYPSCCGSPQGSRSRGTNRGALQLPSFRHKYLNRLAPTFQQDPAWAQLYGLRGHGFIGLVKPYRDGLVHRRRAPWCCTVST